MKLKYITAFLTLISSSVWVYAQTASGFVYEKNRDGEKFPLTGVNVYWAHTQQGTATGADGKFTIDRNSQSNHLVFSYIGYKSDTVSVTDFSKPLTVQLASDAEIEEVVVSERVSGAQYDKMTPIGTQRLLGAELKKAACCNLSESFITNASVDVSYSDAVSGAKQVQLLGLQGKYVQLMTEGYPNYTGLAQNYGLTYIPGPWLNSIFISKGTGSVVHGYESMSGQINIGFKKPYKTEPLYLNVFGSSGGLVETNVYSSYRINKKWGTTILLHSGNRTLENDHNGDGFLDSPLLEQYHAFNRWKYTGEKGFTARFGGKALYENRQGGQKSYDPSKARTADNGYGIGIKTNRYEAFSKLEIADEETYPRYISLITNYSYHKQTSFFGLNEYNATQQSAYNNLFYKAHLRGGGRVLQVGTDLRYDLYSEDFLVQGLDANPSSEDLVNGAYAELSWTFWEKLVLQGGLRADYSQQYGFFTTPRLHTKYEITPTVHARVSAGKGYRKPHAMAENTNLLASSRIIVIDDDLTMESAWNYGASMTKYFTFGKRRLTLIADYFRTDFENQVVVDIDSDVNTIHFYNLNGKSFSNNYQFEVQAVPIRGMETTIAYRYNDVRTTYGSDLKSRPLVSNYKGLFTVSYQTPLKKWQFDFTTQLNGDGRIPAYKTADGISEQSRFGAYAILNAQVTKNFRKWEFYTGSENLLDKVQENPIVDAENPFSDSFNATLLWGPVHGRKFYAGIRYIIE